MKPEIAEMVPADWPEVERIYLEGIETGLATFETQSPGWENWDAGHIQECRLVAKVNGQIVGWAALSPVSMRQVYKGVAEVSIYVKNDFKGKGLGKVLFQELIVAAESEGLWTLQSSVFRENVATIALHKCMGFREIGYREKVGQLHGIWRDTVLLERRSKTVV
ncbi:MULTISPECIES: GNAT family N-acetyltransferase [unclassified Imperialibacter]|uniref:GNAT family N-acetyltransferase n=1 Tax=unclassified Imperialibacter TaxID=2629706 RepID=UPI0012556322|nr:MULTISPECIES: GNAT family N-acetyltransferase [unclassified Imperialibacter]CAD5247462.1 Phosphinothricin acetyltransferase [Imperialibacter sp. 75]CAD5247553.1 Phosphinothricin acetyltransferase [Imperialibacter sp. 89]VVS96892.1 Phosphinothricin acetyltransferase [Imperialibacter sp. EC-SDR9]